MIVGPAHRGRRASPARAHWSGGPGQDARAGRPSVPITMTLDPLRRWALGMRGRARTPAVARTTRGSSMSRANPFHLPSAHPVDKLCAVAPSPQLRARMNERLGSSRVDGELPLTLAGDPRLPGFNDGTILPPSSFRPGTPARDVRRAALGPHPPARGPARDRRAGRLHGQGVRGGHLEVRGPVLLDGKGPHRERHRVLQGRDGRPRDDQRAGRRPVHHAADPRLVRERQLRHRQALGRPAREHPGAGRGQGRGPVRRLPALRQRRQRLRRRVHRRARRRGRRGDR